MLNITCYDKDFNQNFSLQLEKFSYHFWDRIMNL